MGSRVLAKWTESEREREREREREKERKKERELFVASLHVSWCGFVGQMYTSAEIADESTAQDAWYEFHHIC